MERLDGMAMILEQVLKQACVLDWMVMIITRKGFIRVTTIDLGEFLMLCFPIF